MPRPGPSGTRRIPRSGRNGPVRSTSPIGFGVLENSKCVSRKMVLKPDDLIFLYTDGVTEAMNIQEQLFSEGRLKAYRHDGLWLTVNTPKELRTAADHVAAHPEWLN